MKRSRELAPLSRDHHAALAIALRLRRAGERDAAAVQVEFLDFWMAHGASHFRKEEEEEELLPRASPFIDIRSPDVVQVLVDHAEIRELIHALRRGPADATSLARLGERLRRHVRLEEESLFPEIEGALPQESLRELGASLAEPVQGTEPADSRSRRKRFVEAPPANSPADPSDRTTR